MSRQRQRWIAGGTGLAAAGLWAVLAMAQPANNPANRQRPQPPTPQTPRMPPAHQTPQMQPGTAGAFPDDWTQVAELHRRIVQSELGQIGGPPARPFQQPATGAPPTNPAAPQAFPGANPHAVGANANLPGANPTLPGAQIPGNPAAAAGHGSGSDMLWQQFAQKHRQLVQMRAGGQPPFPQGDQPDAIPPGGNVPGANQPDAIPPRTSQPDAIPRGIGNADVIGGTGDLRRGPPTDQLERELGQLYLQILNIDIAEAQSVHNVARPDLNDRDTLNPQTPQRPDLNGLNPTRPQTPPRPGAGSPNN